MYFIYQTDQNFIMTKISKSSFKKIICWNCNVEIIQYFDIKYKGERGVCPVCGANFPLE
jgi:rRNA maturation endonuclease Nob1